jgi:hypothetical protein
LGAAAFKKGFFSGKTALGAADRCKIPAAAGAAAGIPFYFGSAVIAKKTGGHDKLTL